MFRTVFAQLDGVYHGHDGLRDWARELDEVWGQARRMEPEAFFDLGEETLAFILVRTRGARSGAEVSMPVAGVLRWRDCRCVASTVYANREDALRELGVSEDELEPIVP